MDIELSKLLVSQTEVNETNRLVLQILNVAFFVTLLIAQQFGRLLPLSLGDITDLVNPLVAPSGYAFSIWGLIYALITGFVVYQALPSDWVPDRNEDLIYNKMSYAFVVNMFTQMTWFFLF